MKFILTPFLSLLVVLGFVVTSCEDHPDDLITDSTENLTLDIQKLPYLGDGLAYEGWIIEENGDVRSTGTFTVDMDGNMSKTAFGVGQNYIKDAKKFVLTIEPVPDDSKDPSDTHIMAGEFSGDMAMISSIHKDGLGQEFKDVAGQFILATPTDGEDTNETSGVWFLDPNAGPGIGLDLPEIEGWQYEGWAVIDGTPVSTGKFDAEREAYGEEDEFNGFSGDQPGPSSDEYEGFPGEDFLVNAPEGLTFPTDLSSAMIVISLEPEDDKDPEPFAIKPLLKKLEGATDHTPITMDAEEIMEIKGSVKIKR